MQRLFLKLVLSSLLLLFSSIVSAQSSDLPTTLNTRTNLRSGPGVEWNIQGTYDGGTPIRLDGQAYEGSWVRGIVPDGNVGWVITTAVNISPEQASGLRGIWVDEPFSLPAPAGGSAPAPAQPQKPEAPQQAPAAQPPASAPQGGGIETTIAAQMNMRSAPNTSGAVITQLNGSETIRVSGRNPDSDWVFATLPDGTAGWLFAAYVYLSPERIEALPVVQGNVAPPPASAAPEENPPAAEAEAPPPAAPVVNTAPVSGFNLGGHVQGLSATTVSAMRRSGMTWVKKQFRYSGQDPTAAAGIINEAHGNGFRILIGIVGDAGSVNAPGYFEQFAAFLGGVAALGADGIEVWNEPNIDREWAAGSIDPARYTEMLRLAYNAIKGANSNTMVVSGAPAPTGFFGGCSGAGCDDDAFVRGMSAAGATRYMDCIGAHYNEGILSPRQTSGDPRGNSGHYSRYFWGMVNTYSSAVGGARPICFTELGFLSPSGFPPLPGAFAWAGDTSVAEQAQWIDEAVSLAAGSGRVRLLIIWNVDFTNYGSDPMAGYAMIRPDGSCPACDALAN
ncbi:MAG: SH3 domain-containing protein [Anaerolineae bacterium]|nr:SH3 domain-containing protein [Anaerolineae bacterium]